MALLSWNEIKDRAISFSKEWSNESRERAEKDSFWNDFFNVFGISRRRVATFEEPVKKLSGSKGFIDLFWKGQLLIEHKSKGKNLNAAFSQATDYFYGIKEHDLPKYILISDFENFKLYDLDENKEHEFGIKDFHNNIKLFGFIAGYQKRKFRTEDPVNIKAAELMGKLHDHLEQSGYVGHPLEVYLVRLLFSLFADDSGIFEKDTFREFIEVKTDEDGGDVGAWLAQYFQVLNTPQEKRLNTLDEQLDIFPYVNGDLFRETLPIASFNSKMRDIILECSTLNWSNISPAIFGSMFQSVMNPEERRNLGAHYTSEKNILKLIKPLFLDELTEEFEKVKSNKNKLKEFHKKIGNLKFLDPACGCGNFLIITYRELRKLELKILKELYGNQQVFAIEQILQVDVDQFFGIEIDEFPARIAQVALWLTDHQMNVQVSEAFGMYYARLPLKKSAKIENVNALKTNWENIISKNELSYIIGNPPFYGKQYQTKEQRDDLKTVFSNVKGAGVLDYVSAWYYIASQYIQNTHIKVAFVSTNSLTQGEQVSVLWNELLNKFGVKIHFAHTTFNWTNKAKGKAAVHCVIVGFANFDTKIKYLFNYLDINDEPDVISVKNINPYLVEATDLVISKRTTPLIDIPKVFKGNQPTEGGFLLLDKEEKEELENKYSDISKLIKPVISGREFLNNIPRWCFWLVDISPNEIKKYPELLERIKNVRKMRLESSFGPTRELANYPTLFRDLKNPDTFIVIPATSSERRKYIPFGFFNKNHIPLNSVYIVPNGTIYNFGVLTSKMHMTWVKYTCGRLESRFRYSKDIVYNNYPWPQKVSEKNKKKVEEKAQKVLDIRKDFSDNSLADLYDPLAMPPKLTKAHNELDNAVDKCYRSQVFNNESNRIEFLLKLYEQYI